MTYAELAARAGCTQRQIEVIAAIDLGLSISQTARALGISRSSVRTHRDNAYAKILHYHERGE